MKAFLPKILLVLKTTAILLTGCERPADVEVPETSSKLVANAWISPNDTTLRVLVTRSVPTFGTSQQTSPYIENATVRMSDGVNTATFNFNANERVYDADANALNLSAGGKYFLTVEQNGESVSSETVIPSTAATITEVQARYFISTQNQFSSNFIEAKAVWTDPQPQVFNYYSLTLTKGYRNWDGTVNLNESERYLLSDADMNVNTITFRPSLEVFGPVDDSTFVQFHLMTVNRDYFEFHRTTQLNNFGGGPFSEPVLVYSNINGGLGAFGGYLSNRTEVTVEVVD